MTLLSIVSQYPIISLGVALLVITVALLLLSGLIDFAIYVAGIGGVALLVVGGVMQLTTLTTVPIPTDQISHTTTTLPETVSNYI